MAGLAESVWRHLHLQPAHWLERQRRDLHHRAEHLVCALEPCLTTGFERSPLQPRRPNARKAAGLSSLLKNSILGWRKALSIAMDWVAQRFKRCDKASILN